MRPLEIPYNFDFSLIDFLKIYFKGKESLIHSIYLPPFKEDYYSAKEYLPQELNRQSTNTSYPQAREEYFKHIEYINNYFPNKIMLLLQQNENIMPLQTIDQYVQKYYINQFCVGSIKQAGQIKYLFPNIEITGSITMKITKEELEQIKKYKDFTNFVLFFPFNRDLQLIKQLPQEFKYILLVNCSCSIFCDGTHHWFANSSEKEKQAALICPTRGDMSIKNKMIIRPMDLEYFDPYISYYKLQGRECTTQTIITDIVNYTTDWDNKYPLITKYPNLYYKEKLI